MTQKHTELLAELPGSTHVRINWQEWEEFNRSLLGADGVVLVQFLIYHCARLEPEHKGWFHETETAIMRKIGLKKARFDTLIRMLEARNILQTDKKRVTPRRVFYRVRFEELIKPDRLAVIYADLDTDRVKELSHFFSQFAHNQPVATVPAPERVKAVRTRQPKPELQPRQSESKLEPQQKPDAVEPVLPFGDDLDLPFPEESTIARNLADTSSGRNKKHADRNRDKEYVDDLCNELGLLFAQRLTVYNRLRSDAGLAAVDARYKFSSPGTGYVLNAVDQFTAESIPNAARAYFDSILFADGNWIPDSVQKPSIQPSRSGKTPLGKFFRPDDNYQYLRHCIDEATTYRAMQSRF